MTREERTVATATAGLALVAVGAFLPWARVGGRNRSGFSTADTFISLSTGALPDAIAWVGRWWYVPAILSLAAWATTFVSGRTWLRIVGVVAVILAAVMWWLFVWAGDNYNVLDTRILGPIVASSGLALLALTCARSRGSLLRG